MSSTPINSHCLHWMGETQWVWSGVGGQVDAQSIRLVAENMGDPVSDEDDLYF